MTHETALQLVYERLLGNDSIPQKLRRKEGLDQARFDQLTGALRWLIAYYATREAVPKQLALCLVDSYGAFSFREGFYPEADRVIIEDAGLLLQELATDLFS
ncbi:MAG: hypothetical protein ACRYG7_50025 [Janthinobacterium lividum]